MENLTTISIWGNETNISVEIHDITDMKCNWSISDLHLFVSHSSLLKSKIHLHNNHVNKTLFVAISSSILGCLEIDRGFTLNVSDCHMIDVERSEPFIKLTGSSSEISKATFQHLSTTFDSPLIEAMQSRIRMKGVKFKNNYKTESMVKVLNESMLIMADVTFENNTSAHSPILVLSNSSAYFQNCTFDSNSGVLGGVLYSEKYSEVYIKNSTFLNNSALIGGATFCLQSPWKKTRMSSERNVLQTSNCSFVNCIFEGNTGVEKGGVIYARGFDTNLNSNQSNSGNISTYVEIHNCIFLRNVASNGALIFAENGVSINTEDSMFFNLQSSAIEIRGHCNSIFSESNFVIYGLVLFSGHAIAVESKSNITLVDSIFETIFLGNVILSVTDQVDVVITNCTFNGSDSVIKAKEKSLIFLENSRINASQGSWFNSVIRISNHVELYISKTNMTNNRNSWKHEFLLAESDSTLSLSESTYENNNLSSHFTTLDYTNFTLTNSLFANNNSTGTADTSGGLFFLHRSNVTIQDARISNNQGDFNTIMLTSESNLTIKNCVIKGNVVRNIKGSLFMVMFSKYTMHDSSVLNNSVIGFGFIINIFAEHKFIDNYLQVQNCIFRNNVANSVQIDSVSDVVIQSSIFENNTEQVGKGGYLHNC